jgi:DNA-binding beta-propeller fold protein YncE
MTGVLRRGLLYPLLVASVWLGLPSRAEATTIYLPTLNYTRIERVDMDTGAVLAPFTVNGGRPGDLALSTSGELLVANYDRRNVQRYDPASGAYLGDLSAPGGVPFAPTEILLDASGDILLASSQMSTAALLDGVTGSTLLTFSIQGGYAGGLAFGSGGELLVTNTSSRNVQRYDPLSGTYLGNLSAPGALSGVPGDLALGPDGSVYVSMYNEFGGGATSIARVDEATGSILAYIPVMGGYAGGLAFDPVGHLLVANYSRRNIQRYDPLSGALLEELSAPGGLAGYPTGLAFVPEPSTALLLAAGLAALALHRRGSA